MAKNKSSKSSSKKSSKKSGSNSSSLKKEKKQIKKYYKEKTTDVNVAAKTTNDRIAEDLSKVMEDSGIQQTRATEDYIRNIGNISANKAADIEDVNNYVATNRGRTQEDLDTALAKESRRYAIEYDKTNQSLADAGMTFSERKQETIDKADNMQATADINTSANRSFADIARYEAVQNRDIELKYGQQTDALNTTKTRTMEDILNEQNAANLKASRATTDTNTNQAIDIRNIDYAQVGSLTGATDQYNQNQAMKRNMSEILAAQG